MPGIQRSRPTGVERRGRPLENDVRASIRGPFVLWGGFSDLEIRLSHRGLRWVRVAQSVGVSAADRRFRSVLRARYGYGHLRPVKPTPLFATPETFDRTKAQYNEAMKHWIADRRVDCLRKDGDWISKPRGDATLHLGRNRH